MPCIDAASVSRARRNAPLARSNEALTGLPPLPKVIERGAWARTAPVVEDVCEHRFHEGKRRMEANRKPLTKIEGRKRMRLSGLTVEWRGTPSLDDWVAYIVNGTKSRKLILADHASERKVKALLARIQSLSKREVEKLAKG